jgi:NAD(P)-dependent dehydrogenase (short-subunit alcohol dehydrogenase family)
MAVAGKTALLFGAGVLAKGYARLLAQKGASLVLVSRGASAEKLQAELAEEGLDDVFTLSADLADAAQIKEAIIEAAKRAGSVEIMINGAGGNIPQAVASDLDGLINMPPDAVHKVVDVNLMGKWHALQSYAGYLKDAGHTGAVVNIASMSGLTPLTKVGPYSMAFAGVENMCQSMAYVYGHYKLGRVNNLAVGFVCGEQNRRLLYNEDGSATARGQEIMAYTAQHRFLEAGEIAPTVVHLVDDEVASGINGSTYRVDGGYGLVGLATTGWD